MDDLKSANERLDEVFQGDGVKWDEGLGKALCETNDLILELDFIGVLLLSVENERMFEKRDLNLMSWWLLEIEKDMEAYVKKCSTTEDPFPFLDRYFAIKERIGTLGTWFSLYDDKIAEFDSNLIGGLWSVINRLKEDLKLYEKNAEAAYQKREEIKVKRRHLDAVP